MKKFLDDQGDETPSYSRMTVVLDKVDDICERFEMEGLHTHPTYKQFKRLFAELKAAKDAEPVQK